MNDRGVAVIVGIALLALVVCSPWSSATCSSGGSDDRARTLQLGAIARFERVWPV